MSDKTLLDFTSAMLVAATAQSEKYNGFEGANHSFALGWMHSDYFAVLNRLKLNKTQLKLLAQITEDRKNEAKKLGCERDGQN